jgi:hypothetical protein
MKAIFVDAAVVTIPHEDGSREAVVEWLDNLQMWLREALGSHYAWHHFVRATHILEEHRRFPSFEVLKPLVVKYKIDINLPLLMKHVNAFFRDETLDLENKLEELGYLIEVEDGAVQIQPEIFSQRWLDCIQPEMMQLLITACACKQSGNAFGQGLHIVTPKLPEREIEISAIIAYAIPPLECDAENRMTQTFPLLFVPDDLLPLIDVVSLWYEGEEGIMYAIQQQFRKTWQATVAKPMQFRLGPRFIESVNDAGLDTNGIVLEKIVRMAAAVIADKAMEVNCNLRHLRASKAADSPQRTRTSDGAKAWRLTLTDKGVGWRMHYWRIAGSEDSIIEFANVLKKHDPEEIY